MTTIVSDLMRTEKLIPYMPGAGPTFSLSIYDCGRDPADRDGRHVVGYKLTMHPVNGRRSVTLWDRSTLTKGADLRPSPYASIDGDDVVASLLTFLTLRPGDVEKDYFAEYTPAQLAFRDQHAEALSVCAEDLRMSRAG